MQAAFAKHDDVENKKVKQKELEKNSDVIELLLPVHFWKKLSESITDHTIDFHGHT